jgi:phosphatidate cytidylyltransferase
MVLAGGGSRPAVRADDRYSRYLARHDHLVTGHHRAMLVVLAMGTLAAAALAPSERRSWVASGVPYAGALAIAPIVLRADSANGFLAILFLFAIVWATDIVAYFVGRAVGGPKLMSQVSPKKTWSGALGGTAAAVALAVALAQAAAPAWLAIATLAVVLSVVAQGVTCSNLSSSAGSVPRIRATWSRVTAG